MKRNCTSCPFATIMLTLTIMVFSCTPESCLENTVTTVNAVFYQTGTGEQLAPDSVTIFGLGNEQVKIYNKASKINVAKIQLDPSSETSEFYIKVNDIADTITFSYSNYPHLISKECGFSVFHSLSEVSNKADRISILLVNGNITTSNEENIRIFY